MKILLVVLLLGCLTATSTASEDPFAVLGPFRAVPYKFYKTVIESSNKEIRRLLVEEAKVPVQVIDSMVGIITPVDQADFVPAVVKEVGLPFRVRSAATETQQNA